MTQAITETKVETAMNPMREIRIAKITLNVGSGKSEEMLKKAHKLFAKLTPLKSVTTKTEKRIPSWGLRPGLSVGAKVTVRKDAEALVKRLLAAREFRLPSTCFDQNGNFSFGVPEYIDIEGLDYDPELKVMGLEVAVTLERPGFRVKKRKLKRTRVGHAHKITKDEAIAFAQEKLGVEVA